MTNYNPDILIELIEKSLEQSVPIVWLAKELYDPKLGNVDYEQIANVLYQDYAEEFRSKHKISRQSKKPYWDKLI